MHLGLETVGRGVVCRRGVVRVHGLLRCHWGSGGRKGAWRLWHVVVYQKGFATVICGIGFSQALINISQEKQPLYAIGLVKT